MRTMLRGKVTLLFMMLGLLVAIPAVALADQLQDELTSTPATATITQNDSNGFTNDYYVRAVGGGTPPVCDISATNPATFSINVPAGSGVVATPNTLTFTACGDPNTNTQPVKFTSSTANNTTGYAISATQTTGPTNPGISTGDASFTLFVNPAATPPATPTLNLAAASDTGDSNSDKKTNDDTPTFEGVAKTDSTVNVYDGAVDPANLLGSATANLGTEANGNKGWSFEVPANKALSEGTHTIRATATNSGGTSTAAVLSDVLIDKTAPLANCGSASANWSATDASIACAPTDTGGSGLSTATATSTPTSFNLATNVPAGTQTSTASTNSRTIYDVAGNSATAGPISGNMVDKKNPEVNCGSADGNWHANDVSIACTASDGTDGSGLADATNDASFNLSTNVAANTENSNASTGSRNVADAVGNSATAGPISGNMVDKKAPAITLTTPAATTYTLGEVVNANYGCSDLGSGLLSCLGTVNNNTPINTGTIGTHSFKVDAEDNVNNKNSVSRNYSVAAAFNGFLQPIDGDMVNQGKTGRVYPVKWQLKNNSGNLISDALGLSLAQQMSVEQKGVPCIQGQQDSLETEVAAGSTTIRYDEASDQFIFNYKAPTAKGCYDLNLFKADGVNTKTVKFTFTK